MDKDNRFIIALAYTKGTNISYSDLPVLNFLWVWKRTIKQNGHFDSCYNKLVPNFI